MKFFSFFSKKIIFVSLPLLMLLLISGCSSSEQMISTRPEKAVKIDGDSHDWEGSLQSFPKEKYSVGFKNDDKYLYLCFITSDRERINKIVSSGLKVTFNSDTDERRDYTITFPVMSLNAMGQNGMPGGEGKPGEGMQKPPEGMQTPPEGMEKPAEGTMQRPNGKMPIGKQGSQLQDMLDKQLSFNLIEKDYTNSLSLKNNENIELKMGATNDFLVYEMKIPLLSAKSSFPIGALPGEKVTIKFTTAEMKMPGKGGKPGGSGVGGPGGMQGGSDMDGGMQGGPGGMSGGGMGRRGGGMGGPGGGMGGSSKSNEKFEVEISLKLAGEAVKNN
jgi:hypothetical protein